MTEPSYPMNLRTLLIDSLVISNTLFEKDIRSVVNASNFIAPELKTDITLDALEKINRLTQTLPTLKTTRRQDVAPIIEEPTDTIVNETPGHTTLIKRDGKEIAYMEVYDIDANGANPVSLSG